MSKKKQTKQRSADRHAVRVAEKKVLFFPSGFWKEHWIPVLLLSALAFALYVVSFSFGYVLDDHMVITDNIYVEKGFAGLREIFAYDSSMGFFKEQKFVLEGGRYRPLSLATFAFEIGLFGKDKPGIAHFINVLFYAATAILIYRILLAIFPLQTKESGRRWFFCFAFVASVIFVLHPLHVEAVVNIKGRDEILAFLGCLGSLYATLKYFDTEKKRWLIISGISFFLGLLSKENALTFLAVIPLTLWFFTKVPLKRIVHTLLPLIAGAFLFVLARYNAIGFLITHGKPIEDLMTEPFLEMTGPEKYATIFLTLGWYVKLLFWPYPLTSDYNPYHVPKVGWDDWRVLLSFGFYLVIGLYAMWQMSKARKQASTTTSFRPDSVQNVTAWSILYFLATISIVSNFFIGVGTFMNERFAYMPSLAFCVLMAWFFTRKLPGWLDKPPDRPYIAGVALVSIVSAWFAWIVWTRIPDWKDAMSLNTSAVLVSPNSCRAQCFYATTIYQEKYLKSSDPLVRAALKDTMAYHCNRSLEINPNNPTALQLKLVVLAAQYEQDKLVESFMEGFETVLAKIPWDATARNFISQYMVILQRRVVPQQYSAFCHRVGYTFYYKQKNDPKSAIEFLEYGLTVRPDDIQLLNALTEVYQAMGDPAKSAEMRVRADTLRNH